MSKCEYCPLKSGKCRGETFEVYCEQAKDGDPVVLMTISNLSALDAGRVIEVPEIHEVPKVRVKASTTTVKRGCGCGSSGPQVDAEKLAADRRKAIREAR